MQINKNYLIGLLALFSLSILYYGFLFLQGHNIFSKYNDYQVFYPINKNLSVSAPVKLKGHVVGIVTKIEIKPKQNYATLVTIEVDKKFPLTDTSKVMLNNAGMMEGNDLEIELNKGKTISRNDIIIGQIHPDFNEIDLKAMTTQVATVTQNLIKTTEGVNAILINLEKTSATLNMAINTFQENMSTISKNIIAISSPLADSKKGIPAIVPLVHEFFLEIKSLPIRGIGSRLTNILHNTETLIDNASSKRGTFGLFMHDPTLYHNLNNSVEDLNKLILDLKKFPSRYVHFSVFGSKTKKEKALRYP